MMSYDKDWWTTEAMIQKGGSFVRDLGRLYRKADSDNQARIRSTWPEYWKKYSELGPYVKAETLKKEGR